MPGMREVKAGDCQAWPAEGAPGAWIALTWGQAAPSH